MNPFLRMNQNQLPRPASVPPQLLRPANGTPAAPPANCDQAPQNPRRTRQCARIHEPALPFAARSRILRLDGRSGLAWLALGLLLCLCVSPQAVKAQEITDNFDLGVDAGWQHYTPTTAGGAVPQYTFPNYGSGKAYRMVGPALTCQGILQRGGSYRSEQYAEFFYSVDLVNWVPIYAGYALFGGRIGPPGTLAPLSTQGYMNGFLFGAPRQRQAALVNIEFTSEVISTVVDAWRGGASLCSVFPPSRPLRVAVSGTNDTFRTEIYDRTDLLEPLIRINYQDFPHCAASGGTTAVHLSGENLLGWLNLADDDLGLSSQGDVTFDNYHATGVRNTPIGYPGTPQVVNLVPGAQTLFYSIPATNQITFTITTFTANQINTNSVKLLLNDADVSSGLSFTEVRTPVIGTANTNFSVRWNGALTSNTVYHGRITVLDMSGQGTTNNWYFDTFRSFNPTDPSNPSGFLLVEAEDYNYNGGQFQDYPAPSGTDDTTTSEDPLLNPGCDVHAQETLGPQVNGGGLGYYNPPSATDIVGTPDIDFHDNTPDTNPNQYAIIQRHQYRSADRVGTIQGTKGGGLDTPRAYRMGLANNSGGTNSYVPDYVVADMDAGDWMNYTRTFPNNRFNVYVRASSQGRQDVRFDEVTSGSTTSTQTLALRGQFLVPNTESWTRWRYVPLTDGAGNLQTLALQGVKTVRLTANEVRGAHTQLVDIGDLQLNWVLFVPTTNAASTGPWIASAKPSKNSANFPPAGTVELIILDRGTAVVPGSIQLRFDGANVTSAASITVPTTEGSGATVRYTPGLLLPNSTHSISVAFSNGSTSQSNFWNFTVDTDMPLLAPGDAAGGSPDSLFTAKMHKATNDAPATCTVSVTLPDGSTTSVPLETFGNNIARAERQLAGLLVNSDTGMPFENEVAGTNVGQTVDGVYLAPLINLEQCGGSAGGASDRGFFSEDANFPGIYPSNYCGAGASPDHFALAATIKLSLASGVYRMGVNSDDGFKVTAGGAEGTNVYLGSFETYPGTRHDGQFEFVIQTNGVYKFRLVYEEGDGDADCEWYWVNRNTGARDLVKPLVLESAAKAAGPYSADLGALIDPGAKTATVARSGNARFYRLRSSTGLTISSIAVQGNNVLLTYQ